MHTRLACAILFVCWAGCKKDGCDEKGVDRVLGAVPKTAESDRSELIAQGLLEFCGNEDAPMPAALREALTALREWDPWIAPGKIAQAVERDAAAWGKVCKAGTGALGRETFGSRFASLELARACGAEALGYASEAEFGKAPLGPAIASLAAFQWLAESGTDKVRAHRLSRALLGYEP